MAQQTPPPPVFDDGDSYLFRSRRIEMVPVTDSLQQVFSWGTSNRNVNENAIDYLSRKNDKDKPVSKFKKALKQKQKETIKNDPTGLTYDTSLLFLCILWACDKLAPVDDAKWKTPGDDLESLIYSAKEFRNDLAHKIKKMTKDEFVKRTQNAREILEKMLRKAGNFYKVSAHEIEEAVRKMHEQINTIRDSTLVPQNYADYKKLPLFASNRSHVRKEGKQFLNSCYDKIRNVSPVSKLIDFIFKVEQIFTNMIARREGKPDKQVNYEDILEKDTQDKEDPIVLISGLSGMGKTTLIKKILSDWMSGTNTMKKLSSFDFILYVECRNSVVDSFKSLLQYLLPDLWKEFSGDDLMNIVLDLNLLVLVDGLDELNSSSTQLLRQLVDLKMQFGFTLLATTRPERLSSLTSLAKPPDFTINHIFLDGIPSKLRYSFVEKYQKEMKKSGVACGDISILNEHLDRTKDHLDNLWKSPFNLTLLCILWNHSPDKVNSITTAPELYWHIHDLTVEKILERLRHPPSIHHLSEHDRKERVEYFIHVLCQTALSSLQKDELLLSKDSVDWLRKCCMDKELPPDAMLSSFLKEIVPLHGSAKERQLSFPHKGSQEFLASFSILTDLQNPGDMNSIKEFVDKVLDYAKGITKVPSCYLASFTTLITEHKNKRLNLIKMDPDAIKGIISRGSDESALNKYENVLINLLGLFYINRSTEMAKRKEMPDIKKEVLNLLQESGVNERDRWLDVLCSVNCDHDVLQHIAALPGIMEGTVSIKNTNVFAYAQLFQSVPPKKISFHLKGDLRNVLRLEEIFNVVNSTDVKIEHVEFDDENSVKLLEKINMKGITSCSINILKEITEKSSILKILDNVTVNDIQVKKLELHHYYRNPSADIYFKKFLENLSISFLGDKYVGPITESTTLPTTLEYLQVSLADEGPSYSNLCNIVKKSSILQELVIILPLTINCDHQPSIIPSDRQISLTIVIPNDVHDDRTVEDAVRTIRKQFRGKIPQTQYMQDITDGISFPKAKINFEQTKALVKGIKDMDVSHFGVFLPISCCGSETDRKELKDITAGSSIRLYWRKKEEELWHPSSVTKEHLQLKQRVAKMQLLKSTASNPP